jgi:hypothetical protein
LLHRHECVVVQRRTFEKEMAGEGAEGGVSRGSRRLRVVGGTNHITGKGSQRRHNDDDYKETKLPPSP